MRFLSKELSSAEASFLQWQYGFDDADAPFELALWQAIMRAWEADHAPGATTRHLARLGIDGAYPAEVALYISFKSADSDTLWDDLIRRAGLSDRRTTEVGARVERRHRPASGH